MGMILSLDFGNIAIGPDFTGVIALPWTKIGQLRGAQEMVTIDDPLVGRVLRVAFQKVSAGTMGCPGKAREVQSRWRRYENGTDTAMCLKRTRGSF